MTFLDMEDGTNRWNGVVDDVEQLLAAQRGRPAFLAELSGVGTSKLTIGIGDACGCVQHSPADGDVPYWVALGSSGEFLASTEFACGGQPTEIEPRFLLRPDELLAICRHFAKTGDRLATFEWDLI